jgi:hypothetical protein
MYRELRIGLDVDQVIVDFMNPYIKRFGEPKNETQISRNVFQILRHDKEFWFNTPVINRPDFIPSIICSKRCHPKKWSKTFLYEKVGIPFDVPFYQLMCQTMNKSRYIQGKCDIYIDDSVSNFVDISQHNIPCLLMDTPWNRYFDTPYRIFSLEYVEIESMFRKFFNR